jgi:alpha-beta hydrolase superfamily lysophospholipase
VTEQVGWVPTRSGEVFAALHLPGDRRPLAARPAAECRGTAVMLVPPFGWEAMSSARNLRGWARSLAEAGYPAVRYHAPGAGDSAGDARTQDLDTWSAALADLVAHTRAATGCDRIAVVGLGLGGLVAARAVHDRCRVEDLVLWSTPVKGRLLLRELRAFAAMTTEPGDAPPETAAAAAPVEQDGVLWVHGYPLGARAQEQLAQLDLAELDLTGVERALVLGRGTLPHDARLVAALTAAGAEVGGGPGPGYDELTVEPRLSQPPTEVAVQVLGWLLDNGPEAEPGRWPVMSVQEHQVVLGSVSAVVNQPAQPVLTAIFVGAGATPRPGPNRLWTEAARRWAEWGIASLRLDLFGVGEGAGPDAWETGPDGFYEEPYRAQVRSALDLALEEGLPPRFLLVGLCSGGLWAAQTALADDRVVAVVVLNSNSLVWPPPLAPLSPAERFRHLTRGSTWQPLLRDAAARQDAARRIRRSLRLLTDRVVGEPAPGARRRAPANTVQVLRALEQAGVSVTVAVSPGEPSLPDVQTLPPGGGTVVHYLDGPAGAHTLSPAVLRAQAEKVLDEAARAALAAVVTTA